MRCVGCGREIEAAVLRCPACGAITELAGARFSEVEKRLAELKRRLESGAIDRAAFDQEIANLTVDLPDGQHWWLAGEAGKWRYHDGADWIPSQPFAAGRAGGKSTIGVKRRWWIGCGLVGIVAVLAIAVLSAAALASFQTSPRRISGYDPGDPPDLAYDLSADQAAAVEDFGYPQSFSLLFFDAEMEDGYAGPVRSENWDYYQQGSRLTFVNGELVEESPLDVEVGELVPQLYWPEQFKAGMKLDQVVAAAALQGWTVVPLESELLSGGEVYYADGLTFGMKDGRLRFLETIALEVVEP
jgi:hypothetical protein